MTSPPVDLDEQQARRLLLEELAKPEYNRPESLVDRALRWLLDQLDELLGVLPGSGGLSALLIGLVVLVALVAVAFAVRIRLRSSALRESPPGAVLDDPHLSARDYRDRAERAVAAGEWDAALLDSYRAMTASAGERTLLEDAPARTAHEVAVSLGPVFPNRAQALLEAADGFDRVRYGTQSCTRHEALTVRDLDRAVLREPPVLVASP